ncbi:MAG TPA: BMP family ABC transporter substrate-binding protein [Anaerolineae bacterium]|nr:BMP family ABC transporter substrate-binding protein [Anaerolineae bacterium]
MKKRQFTLIALVWILSLILFACSPATSDESETKDDTTSTESSEPTTDETAPPAEEKPTEEAEKPTEEAGFKICEVTDVGGIDDKSFNATAWIGAQAVADELGGEAQYLESQQQTDFERNINAFLEDDCDLIVTVGFLLGDATAAAADANPDQKFSIIDFAYDPTKPNVVGQVYAIDQAAFLAGYIAASVTETGIIGTFGGINIPPVTAFMDGFVLGAEYYNEQNGTDVQVLGWNVHDQDGLFTGNFDSTDDGRSLGESLMDEGADVILPVAGPVGLGTAAAVQERGDAWIVGVDTDWTQSASEFSDIILTSIMKRMDVSVAEVAKQAADGSFEGGVYVSTLANGGVAVTDGPYDVDISAVQAGIIDGSIPTNPSATMMDDGAADDGAMAELTPVKVCEVTDVGGIDDKSFNATAWVGAQAAAEVTGGEAQFLESQQQTDFSRNISAFVDDKCDLIVGVGFLLGDAIAEAAAQNPDQNFTIIDFAYDPTIPNVVGQVYVSNQPAFLAGMIAADTTETGVVGVFGGINIPPVTDFMDGFVLGVNYYNEQNGTDVQVLGWDVDKQDGLFAGNFESTDDGRTIAESLMDEGADVIFPLAGAVGLGSAAAIQERGNAWLIGADTDWRESAPEFADITLVSTLKRMDTSLVEVAKLVSTGVFEGGVWVGTLENGGVGITDGPYDIDLSGVIEQIIAGEIQTAP